MRYNSSKELFNFIRKVDLKNVKPLKLILQNYTIGKISIESLLNKLKNEERFLLIDARSEKEFDESSIPGSFNFPVLDNSERHNVGLIYKKYSQTAALWLAMQYADPKSERLKEFLNNNNAEKNEIIVYCWRGGGRSGYLSKMISDLGYHVTTLSGGQKEFRKKVNDFFSLKEFPIPLIELSGLTGCGKSELLESVSTAVPVINLERAARHCSSLLGQIPYQLKNFSPVKNQAAFENNIFSQIILTDGLKDEVYTRPFLVESESKKVGDFRVPDNLHNKLQNAPTIKIVSTLENRVKRIVKEYFGNDSIDTEPVRKKMLEKKTFFCQQMSNKIYEELMYLLNSNRVAEFSGLMLTKYYDIKYKDKGKKAIAEISTDNISVAENELLKIYNEFTKQFKIQV